MGKFSKQRQTAIRWIYERNDNPMKWWRWSVLTHHNNVPETLGYDDLTAYLIFSDLVHDGLLVPCIGTDGIEAFLINDGKEEQWQQAMSPVRYFIAHNTWRVFEWVVSGVIGAIVGIGVASLWETMIS